MKDKNFYITTPIYYVNDRPHIGHAYTTIAADALARLHAARGEAVIFLAGTDENSQKTVDAAKKIGEEIHAYTDRLAEVWRSAWKKLGIANTDFIRTTEKRHIEVVREIWSRMKAAGDIYKGKYEGLYCEGHEAFMKENELIDGLCPDHKTKPEHISEENYFFRLSKYEKPLLNFYKEQEDFVAPAHRFNEIKSFVAQGLEDISFSREKKIWGIPVPSDPEQVIYVWADALVNYISAVGIDGWNAHPADVHMVGKDILRFHAVIWPAMLMSSKLPLPKQVVANGFFTIDGVKISKSLGNAVDPLELVDKYRNDALRYFLLREISYGEDGDFSEEKFKERYNADLANGLGNFAARVLTLGDGFEDIDGGISPDGEIAEKINYIKNEVDKTLQKFKLNEALAAIWELISFGDAYVNDRAPWAIKDKEEKKQIVLNLIVILDNVAALLAPFLPETADKITKSIIWQEKKLTIKKGEILFPRLP